MFISRPAPGTQAGARSTALRLLAAPITAMLLLVLLALLLRAPGFAASVLDPDEGLYLLQAVAWLRGGWPYLAVWDMHPVGAPGLLALPVALIPSPLLAMRLAGVASVAATAVLLRLLVMRLGGDAVAGFAAGLLYIAHSLVLGGLATNTEILFAPFMVGGALLLLGEALRPAPPRPAVVLAAGLVLGVALWVKQVVGLEASALWLTMIGVAAWRGRLGIGRLLLLAVVFALGCGLPTALTAATYAALGAFDEWWRSNVLVLLNYSAIEDGSPGLRRGLAAVLGFLLWPIGAALLLLLVPRRRRLHAALLLPWLAAASVQAIAPLKFFDHYFLMLLAPLCALAALGLAAAARHAVRLPHRAAAVLLLAIGIASLPVATTLLPRLGTGFGWRLPDPPAQVAAIARANLAPGEAMWVVNWHPVTYVLAGHAPPTRFPFPSHLAGPHAVLTGIDYDAELDRVLALPPRIIVIAPSRWWRVRPEAKASIESALAGYDRIAQVPDGDGPVEVWRRR